MYWIILILGVALWWGAHLFKRVAPDRRATMGNGGKGIVAGAIGVSIILMIVGFRGTPYVDLWTPPTFMTHINNLLMIIAIFMLSPAPKRGKVLQGMRHPMLTGFGVWTVAHLLVNGDLSSIIMFGGLLVWAIMTARIVTAAEPNWTPNTGGTLAKDGVFLVGSIVVLGVIGMVHTLLGKMPFPT